VRCDALKDRYRAFEFSGNDRFTACIGLKARQIDGSRDNGENSGWRAKQDDRQRGARKWILNRRLTPPF
jgi:hypothetical protein